MILYIIGGVILIAVIFVLSVKNSKKQKIKLQQKAIEEEQHYRPQIESYFKESSILKEKYVTKRELTLLKNKWRYLLEGLQSIRIMEKHPLFNEYIKFYKDFSNIEAKINEQNKLFIENQSSKYDDLLSNIDGKSLDQQQREVVISDEDRTLVLAGAGSGKTLTIAAKVKYLCEVLKINPEDILLISFTNKSAAEMTERIQNKLGIPVEATTFHKLGLDIIKSANGYRPDVFDELNTFVQNFFENDIIKHPDLVRALTEYFTYYLEIPEDMEKCSSLGEAYEIEKAADLETLKSKYDREKYVNSVGKENAKLHETLNGEHVKSLEETKIANFLFMHGINYEYERLYPYESDDPMKKAYRPDFYLSDYDIYLEHFGITRDYKCPWLSAVEEEKYVDGIKWKREFHQQNNTKLIETYSYNMSEGNLLTVLEKLLQENGVVFKERDFNDIFETIYVKQSNKYFSEFIKLCSTFITLFKSDNYKIDKIHEMQLQTQNEENEFKAERTRLFLEIVSNILIEYQNYLEAHKAIDFSDMINDAADKVVQGANIPAYKYVIVDEYQDISLSRFSLLKAIVDRTNAKLLCVGDDWQSIYRFAGSDISLFTNFEKYLGFTKTLKIEKTYRNSQQLIDEASNFILQNPVQLKKKLSSGKSLDYPLVFWGYNDDPSKTLDSIIKKIISEFGPEKSILLLGRTNFDIDILKKSGLFRISRVAGEDKIQYIPSPSTPVAFLSVHKSKGLEADNVILLNFKNDKLGFPNQIADDPTLNLVLTQAENFPFAEERRLFYVAITRTKNRTFILTDNRNPSIFLKEFEASNSVCFVSIISKKDEKTTKCPHCKTGDLLKIDNDGKSFIGCSNFPKCKYSVHDVSILVSPKQCPRCGGFLVKRRGKNKHPFIGCTNYPYCEYTEEILKE